MLGCLLMGLGLLVAGPSLVTGSCYTCGSTTAVLARWSNHMSAEFSIPISSRVSGGWRVELRFTKPVTYLEIWRAEPERVSNSVYILKNKSWNRDLAEGTVLEMSFIARFTGRKPRFSVRLIGQLPECGSSCRGDEADGGRLEPTVPSVASPLGCRTCCSVAQAVHEWPGYFDGQFTVPVENQVREGWEVELIFSSPVINLQLYDAEITDVLNEGRIYRAKSKHYNQNLEEGSVLTQRFQGAVTQTPSNITIHMVGQPQCCEGDDASCSPTTAAVTPSSAATTASSTETSTDAEARTTAEAAPECPLTSVVDDWPGHFKGEFVIPIRNQVTGGWTVRLEFAQPVSNLQVYRAHVVEVLEGGLVYVIRNREYNADLQEGALLQEQFQASADSTPEFSALMIGQPDCTVRPTATDESATGTPPATGHPSTSEATPTQDTSATPTKDSSATPTQDPSEVTPTQDPSGATPTHDTSATPTQDPSEATPTETPSSDTPSTEAATDTPTAPSSTVASEGHTTTLMPADSTTAKQTPPPSSAPYNYGEAIHKSILFYEAQRSGPLPPTNRVPWRSDSTLTDRGQNGEDLTGGWFDAGDHVKFGFPMASTVTVLAWGLVEYRDAYAASGELNYMLDCIKWATDYFLKCHTGQYEFYGQVGDGNLDHGYWGRPEDMTLSRPAFKVTSLRPGSDLTGETAAALAAASIAFRPTDAAYADELLRHAQGLYDFADRYRGVYTNAIPNAANFYGSHSGYGDELAWSAAWLARATGQSAYLTAAADHYTAFAIGAGTPWAFSWDDKKAGVMLLMYQLTGAPQYKAAITDYLDSWQRPHMTYTPNGLAWRDQWGTNRYAANTAFLALVAADEGIEVSTYRTFAKEQINYMLGDGGRSYVVGFGTNPPHSPHHRGSSCPDRPASCTWQNLQAPGPNPQVLEGALVGGPDRSDGFVNDRQDYIQNEVACDYNAGYQSALAGLKSLDIRGLY